MSSTVVSRAGGTPRKTSSVASNVVADMIRNAIISRELLPGEHVCQQEWAERAKVSRPPAREALEVLAKEGLLEHSLNRGYFVAKVSLHEMRQLYLMRRLLERETAATIVWPSPGQLETLHKLASRARAAQDAGDTVGHREIVTEFLLSVHRLSENQLVVDAVEKLWERTMLYRALAFGAVKTGLVGSGVMDAVLTALAEQDRDALTEALLRPSNDAYAYVEEQLSHSPNN